MLRIICGVVLAVLLTACATESVPSATDNWKAANYKGLPKAALIILLPPEPNEGVAQLTEQLGLQIKQAGYEVSLLERQNYELIWAQEVAAVGGIYDPSNGKLRVEANALAQARLVIRICRDTGAAMVLQSKLSIRQAKLQGNYAVWDGQQRSLSYANPNDRWEYEYKGTTNALSVELRARGTKGEPMFLSYGGVSLAYVFNTKDGKARLRKDLFTDVKEMADGVHEALTPLRSASAMAEAQP